MIVDTLLSAISLLCNPSRMMGRVLAPISWIGHCLPCVGHLDQPLALMCVLLGMCQAEPAPGLGAACGTPRGGRHDWTLQFHLRYNASKCRE